MFENLKKKRAVEKARQIAILISDSSNEILQKSESEESRLTHEHIAYMWAWFEVLDDLCFYRDDYSIKAVSFWLTQVAASNGPEIAEAYAVTVPAFYSKISKGIEPFKSGSAVVPMLGELACNYLQSEGYDPDLEVVLSVMKAYTLKAKP